ncbi:hypothetical protein FRC06_006978, partial [Ceratobasidium sp. 370]
MFPIDPQLPMSTADMQQQLAALMAQQDQLNKTIFGTSIRAQPKTPTLNGRSTALSQSLQGETPAALGHGLSALAPLAPPVATGSTQPSGSALAAGQGASVTRPQFKID